MKNDNLLLANLKYERKFYELVNITGKNDKRDYILKFSNKPKLNDLFTHKIRIEKHAGKGYLNTFRQCFYYWFIQRTSKNWETCLKKTGLLNTSIKFAYYGDIPIIKNAGKFTAQHFILLQLSDDAQTLVLDIFKDFIPTKTQREQIIKNHNFVYNNSNREITG